MTRVGKLLGKIQLPNIYTLIDLKLFRVSKMVFRLSENTSTI